jgi:NADPH:quinone reductase-like Zn-dependent oxidoreductase
VRHLERILANGEIGGRTAQIIETGEVVCEEYPLRPLDEGEVRVRTVRSAISPGTEMTFYGRDASNVYLHKRWDPRLRLFVKGRPSLEYPIVFGYRAAGEVVESRLADVPVGERLFGAWRHTEFTVLPAVKARTQRLPPSLGWDDGVDLGQMAPICLNGVVHAEGLHAGQPAVVFGAGPVGLITAQTVRATGAITVVVVDRLASRLRIAAGLGLEPLDTTAVPDVAVALKRRFGADSISVAFECTGSTGGLNEAIRAVRRRGRVVALGFYQGEAIGLNLGDEFHHNGVEIRCGQIGNIHVGWDRESLRDSSIRLAMEGRVVLGGLPRVTVPIEEVGRGFEALRRPDEILQVAISYD